MPFEKKTIPEQVAKHFNCSIETATKISEAINNSIEKLSKSGVTIDEALTNMRNNIQAFNNEIFFDYWKQGCAVNLKGFGNIGDKITFND